VPGPQWQARGKRAAFPRLHGGGRPPRVKIRGGEAHDCTGAPTKSPTTATFGVLNCNNILMFKFICIIRTHDPRPVKAECAQARPTLT